MWMDLYSMVRTPTILIGIGLFAIAIIMLLKDYINRENRRASAISIILILILIALAASMI